MKYLILCALLTACATEVSDPSPVGANKFAMQCDDGDPCTIDSAVQVPDAAPVCKHQVLLCPQHQHCSAYSKGACVSDSVVVMVPLNCDDGNVCTKDVAVNGKCTHTQSAGDCSDGNPCTQDGCCVGTACGGEVAFCVHKMRPDGPSAACPDQGPCLEPVCQDGYCAYPAKTGTMCSDGNPCTSQDSCDGGACVGTPNNDKCSDGDSCTALDSCMAGECVGEPVECEDNNPCTNDLCSKKLGCMHVLLEGPCDDGNACTTECCSAGVCKVKSFVPCDDNNVCTTDSCNPVTGECEFKAANGMKCGEHATCQDSCCYED